MNAWGFWPRRRLGAGEERAGSNIKATLLGSWKALKNLYHILIAQICLFFPPVLLSFLTFCCSVFNRILDV